MHKTNIRTSGHVWQKTNLVTVSKDGKYFDEMVCQNCGMKGRRYNTAEVEVPGFYNRDNALRCPKAPEFKAPEKVKITLCTALGPQFANLVPGSVHGVVTPPTDQKNDLSGVWVMGVGEPVKLWANEFVKERDPS